jgi:NTP pyrophosphatase (non-canonical NTP hydrolase)
MTLDEAMEAVRAEVAKATTKFPTWPTRIIDAGNVVSEEAGELAKACLQATYEKHKIEVGDVMMEAVQTGAMAVRFLMSMERYCCEPGPQHHQAG